LRDEFAQFLKSVENQPHFMEMKDYLLRLYDGEEISRSTLKNETIIENPASFFRRIMFRGIRYSLIYHILLGKTSERIDEVDMGWAGRICALHVRDACELLEGHDKSELQNLLNNAEKVIQRLEEKGEAISPRNLVRNMAKIKNTQEAKAILQILGY